MLQLNIQYDGDNFYRYTDGPPQLGEKRADNDKVEPGPEEVVTTGGAENGA
jgi:hypothetical protein